MQKYLQHGIHAFEAQGAPGVLHGAGRAGPSVDAKKFHKGSFILERGNGSVVVLSRRCWAMGARVRGYNIRACCD